MDIIIIQARVMVIMAPGDTEVVETPQPFNLAHQELHLVGVRRAIDLNCLNQETGGH